MPLPLGLEGVFAQMFGKAVGEIAQSQSNPLMRSVLVWVSVMQEHAIRRWQPIVASGIRCALRPRSVDGMRFVACPDPAIGACCLCGQPTCLKHAMVDGFANVLCHKCLASAAQVLGKQVRGEDAPPPPPPTAQEPDETKLRKKFLKELELEDRPRRRVTEEEIREQFRALMLEHHPDRQRDERKKEAARKRAAKLTEAYHWLIDERRKKVA